MNIVAWILQGLVAFAFGMAGFMKATQPREKLLEQMAWVNDFSPTQVKIIGVLEMLGAIGLLLPAITGILPELTGLAAIGLMLTMTGAALTHLRRKEYPMVAINAVLFALALAVAYLRLVEVPLA